ncbi:alpha/beta fold hydrolase [Pseudoduganella rhizocola]|uniref:alpha/beta fold hydrolase n=1 Tax=Pseudoduganella rhizocola TaxID=3382643 RepID=UPI0038B52E66
MFIKIDGARIRYSDEGAGPILLLLHGIPDCGAIWDGMVGALRDNYRCLAPDLPGFGDSGVPAGLRIDLRQMGGFVAAFLDALGVDQPVHLVVHDIGGPYGLAWAVQQPERVASITIMNTVFQAEYRWHRYGQLCRLPLLGELLQLLLTQAALRRAIYRNSGQVKRRPEQVGATYARLTASVRAMVLRLYRGLSPQVFEHWDTRLRALNARIPSQVLWGDLGSYIDHAYAERFGAQTVHHFTHCGHWPMAEFPLTVARHVHRHVQAALGKTGHTAEAARSAA